MKTFLESLIAIACAGMLAGAQDVADPYSTGATLWEPKGCPIFVGGVMPGSPAERAGVRAGDRLLSVNGAGVENMTQAVSLLRSDKPASVTLKLSRGGKEFEVVVEREKRSSIFARNGQKIISGLPVPLDTSEAEVERMLRFDGRRILTRVFPTHYPTAPELFCAGFEMFVLRDSSQVAVGGIEEGPASRAGVHWGDVILAVNGVPTAGKTPAELEHLFTGTRPTSMRLEIDRLGSVRMLEFKLEKASDIARQNGRRMVDGHPVPLWVTDEDLPCFTK